MTRIVLRSMLALALMAGAAGSPASADGDLLVASFQTDNVLRYDAETGAFLGVFASHALLDGPEDLVVGPDGHVYVTSRNNTILRFHGGTGAFLGTFVSANSGGLNQPAGLLFTGDTLLVASRNTDQILRYNATTGLFLGAFVGAGSGGLNGPNALAIGPDNHLYVVSMLSNNVLRYHGQTGVFLGVAAAAGSGASQPGGHGLTLPRDLKFGPDGFLYVTNTQFATLLRYNGQTGVFLDVVVADNTGGTDLTFGPDGNLYVSTSIDQGQGLFGGILRYRRTNGAFLGKLVNMGSGGLLQPAGLVFRGLSGPCVRDAQTACLLDDRFEVKVRMKNFANPPAVFPGVIQSYQGASSETEQSVSFYSFNFGNVEVFVKMVNACSAGSHSFWLFAAGATSAETEILVRDSVAEETYFIYNPSNVLFESLADTQAFLTCDE